MNLRNISIYDLFVFISRIGICIWLVCAIIRLIIRLITRKARRKAYCKLTEKNERLRRILVKAGVCPDCELEIIHDFDEPFANCGCYGTMEWTSEPPVIATLRRELGTQRNLAISRLQQLVDRG